MVSPLGELLRKVKLAHVRMTRPSFHKKRHGHWFRYILFIAVPSVLLISMSMNTLGSWWRVIEQNPNNPTQQPRQHSERFLTPNSGCLIADWAYRVKKRAYMPQTWMWSGDCDFVGSESILDNGKKLSANESVYVPYNTLKDFVKRVLPEIDAPFVLITGTYGVYPHYAATTYEQYFDWIKVLEHPQLLHLYNMNPWFRHPKQSGWPYGIMNPLEYEPFYDAPTTEKSESMYFGPLGLTNVGRLALPGFVGVGKRMKGHPSKAGLDLNWISFDEYAQSLASHQFVFSPDGDRKDCVRNYEALGLGSQPVTDLNIYDYNFYRNCGLIFDEALHDWENLKLKPAKVERRVVLNEYWASKLSHAIHTRDFRLHC